MHGQSAWLALIAFVTPMLAPSELAAAGSDSSPAVAPSMMGAAASDPPAGAPLGTTPSVETSPPEVRLLQISRGPRYGLSAAAPLAGPLQPKTEELSLSGRRHRMGMTGEAEILAWSTGIGAVIGLTTGLREDENAIESTLKGAAMGFILPIALFAAMASTVPRAVPVSPDRPTGLTMDAVSSSRLQDNAPPLLHLRLSGQRARGQADRYVALGVGSGVQLSYVMGW